MFRVLRNSLRSLPVATLLVISASCSAHVDKSDDGSYASSDDGVTRLTDSQADQVRRDREQETAAAVPRPRSEETLTKRFGNNSSPVVQSAGFSNPPPDSRSDCTDPNSAFVQWINSVTSQAIGRGGCVNAKGVYLINSEGAKKSRYCAQFFSGTARQQSLQQADAYDQTARQAQQTIQGICG